MQLTHGDVLSILPDRAVDGHKGNYGKILLLCGSRGYTGAAALAAMGALRCGAGLVFLGVPESIYEIEAVKLTEPIVFPLPEEDGKYAIDAVALIQKKMRDMDAVLIGPGMGQSAGTMAVLNAVLQGFDGPVVVDADGINLLATDPSMLHQRKGVTILTPHEGEFRRLVIGPQDDRVGGAVSMATALGCIVVRKGHETIITDGKTVYINPTGNPGMAVGGSGDVLAGMLAGLLGQGIEPLQAAACAVWLHGAAGDRCAEKLGQYAMLPSDMLAELPYLLK
ncbi:MAG: NAD(P)H-hydrate dehydratase [Ruminococcaceae bacterium]|nr:NAD(P)H-hydrate dehydratase [Oscillospiraceae bacterium]